MAVKGEEKDKVKGNLDILFGRLQPYLQILSHDPINVAKDILRSLRDYKEADVISEELSRRGIGCLENETLDYLERELSVHPIEGISSKVVISEIKGNLSKIGTSLIRLKNSDRLRILKHFFPKFLVYQPLADGSLPDKSRPGKIAYNIEDPKKRNFYDWCVKLSEDKALKPYIGCFFYGDVKTSRICRDLFTEVFISNAEEKLDEMQKLCEAYLQTLGIDRWPEEKISEFRSALIDISCEMIVRLREMYHPSGTESLMFLPSEKEIREEYYLKSIHNQINDNALSYSLARIIASTGIIVEHNVSSAFKEQEKAICNIWGWELEAAKELWQKKLPEGIIAYDDGRYIDAWELFESARRLRGISSFSGPSEAKDFADMLCLQAHLMMSKGFGIKDGEGLPESEKNKKILDAAYQKMEDAWEIAAENGISSKSKPYSARAYYEFAYHSCRELDGTDGILSDTAKEYLQCAVNENCIDAVLLKAHLLLTGEYGYIKDSDDGIKLLEDDVLFANASKMQKRERITMLTDYCADSIDPKRAEYYLEEAARLGSYAATTRLREMHMKTERGSGIVLSTPNDQSICLFNSDPSAAPKSLSAILLTSLPEDLWKHETLDDYAALSGDHLCFLNYGRIAFSLMSDDEEKNLTDAIRLIQQLNTIAAQQEDSVRAALISRIDIYLFNTSEACPLLIDAVMGNLEENVYFKVHICDPDLSAANELLTRLPTFLPCISRKNGEIRSETWPGMSLSQRCKRRVVVLGTNRSVEVLIKQIIATTFLANYPTELTVIGPQAEAMKKKFEEECPGLDPTVDRYVSSYIIPSFYQHDPDKLPLNRACTDSDAEVQQILRTADYFVISGEDDHENLALGVKLRRNLLRHHPDPAARPYIAIRYRDHHSAWIASQVAVSSKNYTVESGWSIRHHWSEDYDLHLFGSNASFESDSLFVHYIENQALELHKSYYGTMYKADPNAEGAFYRRSYNRDSSIAAFIGIIYRCFAAGAYYHDPGEYKSDSHSLLGKRYYSILHDYCPVCKAAVKWEKASEEAVECCSVCKQTKREINAIALETAAEIEHARWRCFCASRGWSAPSEKDLIMYLQNGNPKHLLEIGLLHPYMVGYSSLPNTCARINHLIDEYHLELKKLSDPCEPDREFVRRAPALLDSTGDSAL